MDINVDPSDLSSIANECIRCDYDLRGIADDQACPECGLLALRSRRPSDELHDTRPRWLFNLSWGIWLILLAIAITVLWPFAVVLVVNNVLLQQSAAWMNRWSVTILLIGCDVAAAMLVAGVFLLTAPGEIRAGRPLRSHVANLCSLLVSDSAPLVAAATRDHQLAPAVQRILLPR